MSGNAFKKMITNKLISKLSNTEKRDQKEKNASNKLEKLNTKQELKKLQDSLETVNQIMKEEPQIEELCSEDEKIVEKMRLQFIKQKEMQKY